MNSDKIILWTARIWSILSISFMLIMIAGHIFGSEPQVFNGTSELLAMIFFPVGVLIGLILAWKWEGIGGIMSVVCISGLYIIRPELIFTWISLLAAPGLLFFAHWLMSMKATQAKLNRA
jgi:hypothetical protein